MESILIYIKLRWEGVIEERDIIEFYEDTLS